MEPREVIAATSTTTNTVGARFMFHPDTVARGNELGLSAFRFYFVGRGGVLGNVEPGVIHSAFGYFHPDMVAKLWTTGCEIVAPRSGARAYLACNHELGRSVLADTDGLAAYVDAATTVIEAADGVGMALFAGFRAEPVPDDAPAAALHQATVLRELRGSAHLAALASVGLASHVAHAVHRPDSVSDFGWGDDPPVPSDDDRRRWAVAEQRTDEALVPAFGALSADQATALIAGTEAIAGAFPS